MVQSIIVKFGIRVTGNLIIITHMLICILIALDIHNGFIYISFLIFGVLDQSLWITTTYVISFLYPIKTNLLISACFTSFSFSTFLWANFATFYINNDNRSIAEQIRYYSVVNNDAVYEEIGNRLRRFYVIISFCTFISCFLALLLIDI